MWNWEALTLPPEQFYHEISLKMSLWVGIYLDICNQLLIKYVVPSQLFPKGTWQSFVSTDGRNRSSQGSPSQTKELFFSQTNIFSLHTCLWVISTGGRTPKYQFGSHTLYYFPAIVKKTWFHSFHRATAEEDTGSYQPFYTPTKVLWPGSATRCTLHVTWIKKWLHKRCQKLIKTQTLAIDTSRQHQKSLWSRRVCYLHVSLHLTVQINHTFHAPTSLHG